MNEHIDRTRDMWWRAYVGGLWDDMGPKQFQCLKALGMKPSHKLLDVGCGCFRAGRFFVDYLDAGNYYAIDADADVVGKGMKHELTPEQAVKVRLHVTDCFELTPFIPPFNYVIAQSVFTHLPKEKVLQCLNNVYNYTDRGAIFVMTIFEAHGKDHPWPTKEMFKYTLAQIRSIAGDKWVVIPTRWKHTRRQTWLALIRQ